MRNPFPADHPSTMHQLSLFSTPVTFFDLPDMDAVNKDITARLLAESQTVPSVHRSNVGGWHSQNLALRPEPSFRQLISTIRAKVVESVEALARERQVTLPPMRVGVYAWAMVMRNGDYTMPHDHAEVHWGTVYYPDAGDADEARHPESGMLALVDPRQGLRQMPGLELSGSTFSAKPRTGRLVVFPGWLMHYVHAYRGTRPRVAISCNCIFDPTGPLANERVSVASPY